MNVGDEHSVSVWMDGAPAIEAERLAKTITCDVAIVGAGMAGLSTAYELVHAGRSVAVIDRGTIGRGMTARTTGHLTTENDDRYVELIRVRGEEEARLYHASQVAAVNRIEAIIDDERIDCDFVRLNGYLFAAEKSHQAQLEDEYAACHALGIEDVDWAELKPTPGTDWGRALRFGAQARFHATKYLAGLARAVRERGGSLYADTAYLSHEEKDGGVILETEPGPKIKAGAAVFTTNSPVIAVDVHMQQVPDRTYVIAGKVPKGSVEDAVIYDTWQTHGPDRSYHYVRIQPLDGSVDLLIVGGEDHRSGDADDMDERFARLEAWTRENFRGLGFIEYRWSGQVMETVDYLPFSGRKPDSENIYFHTGDSGTGLTNAVAGALTIAPLILGRHSRFAALFDPARKTATAIQSLSEMASGAAAVARNLTEHVRPGDVASADALKPGQGAIVREGGHKVAAYRDEDGRLIRHSAACSHMGCIVHWNPFERCWDCPCHGSQFAPDGQVFNGPATVALGDMPD